MRNRKLISMILLTSVLSTLIGLPSTAKANEASITSIERGTDDSLAVYKSAANYVDNFESNEIYNKIYNDLLLRNSYTSFNIQSSVSSSSINYAFTIFYKVLADHPELFYVYSGCSGSYDSLGNVTLNYTYIFDESDITTFNNKVDYIISNLITPDMTELEKEIAIHDYIVTNVSYSSIITNASHSAYGAIINNDAVCDGYSKAMKVLLNKVGVECEIISSSSMNHAWNIVTIDGERYHVDATWDDPIPDKGNTITYTYFNQSDAIMRDASHNHYWNYSDYKACTSNKYSYFSKMRDAFRLDNTIYYTDSSTYSFKSADINGTNFKITNKSYMYSSTYHNGWVYCAYYYGGTYLARINLKNPSKIEILASNVRPTNIYIKNGQVYYYDSTTASTKATAIPNYNKYDFNGDNNADIMDIAELASNYNRTTLSAFLKSNQDMNNDEIIDIYDITMISKNISD